jgi:hypothetical protein
MNEPSNSNLAISAQQLRAEVTFSKTGEILAAAGIDILLLKGPHLGHTVYGSPKDRLYCDLDILVKPADFEKAAELLLENAFLPFAYDTFSPQVQRDFKHWEFRSPWGIVVELHRWLSGHDRYPIDSGGLFARAERFTFGQTQALGLGPEDLLLHLCLHMGTSYFHVIERKHVVDIALLTRGRPIDWPVLLRRAKKAGAGTIVYYALLSARKQENALVPAGILDGLRPGKLRRLWVEKSIDPGHFPIYRFPGHELRVIKRRLILPLMDRPGQWVSFFTRIVALKINMAVHNKSKSAGEQ